MTSRFQSEDRHTAPARLVTKGDPNVVPDNDYGLRPNTAMMFDARLQGKRQAENVHFDVDADGKVTVVLFEVPPPADLRCVICWELFRDPVITPCGHSFCRACVDTELNASGRCPICRRPTNPFEVSPNLLAKTLVEELDVHCTYGCTFKDNEWVLDEEGCPETIKFGLRKVHHKVCDFAQVRCPYGGDACPLLPRLYLEDHMEEECLHNAAARAEDQRRRRNQEDPLEMMGIFLVWSLVVVFLLQTEYFGPMLRKAAGPLIALVGLPVALAFLVMLAEYAFNVGRGLRSAKDEEDMD